MKVISLKFLGSTLGMGLLSSTVMGDVGLNDLREIRDLFSAGKHEEALKKHLSFHEESKTSRGMGGVRLSAAISQWAELGQVYPPALEALTGMRERHAAALLKGEAGFPEFHEVSAINRALKEDQKTYLLFTELHTKQPYIAKSCFNVSLDLIVQNKNYELCGAYLDDPAERYRRLEEMRELNLSLTKKSPQMDTPHFKDYTDRSFTTKTVQLIDILVQLKRTTEAREIQKRALAYFPTPEVTASLPP